MAIRLEVVLDCADAEATAAFWAQALHYEPLAAAGNYRVLSPLAPVDGPTVIIQQVPEPKAAKNRAHIDVLADDIEAEATRLQGFGARRLRADPVEEHGMRWVVMADPEGNEFCICHSDG